MSSSFVRGLVISSSDSSSDAVEGGGHDGSDDSFESEGCEKGGELDSGPSQPFTLPTPPRRALEDGFHAKAATYSPGTGAQ